MLINDILLRRAQSVYFVAEWVLARLWAGKEPNPPSPFPAREGGAEVGDGCPIVATATAWAGRDEAGVNAPHGSPFPRREGGQGVRFSLAGRPLAPVLILPLFYKLKPLEDEELAARLTRLAERAGTRVQGVYSMDFSSKGTTANAALMGLGRTRRIVLADTLLDRYTPDEIEVILAHELAHHVHRDIPKGIVVETAVVLASFWLAGQVLAWAVHTFGFAGVGDLAAFPLLALTLGAVGLIVMPLTNAFSRWLERAADRYALEATDDPASFISAMTRLTDQNLGEAHPPRWVEILFHDHPSYADRVAMARRHPRTP